MVVLLRPAYDPQAKEWFTEDGRTAKTLSVFPLERNEVIADYTPFKPSAVVIPKVVIELRKPLPLPRREPQKPLLPPPSPPVRPPPVVLPQVLQRRKPPVKRRVSPWNEADDKRLLECMKQGLTSNQISRLLGRTRNSIIGHASRKGWKWQGKD